MNKETTNLAAAHSPTAKPQSHTANPATKDKGQMAADRAIEADRRREERHIRALESQWSQYAD